MNQRRLMVDSIENIRDLGGYSTANNTQTRWRSFVRADHFQAWTPKTQQTLIEYGVKLVIDLRAPHEAKAQPNSFAGSGHVTYLNLPLMPDEVHSGDRFQGLLNTLQDNAEMYIFMLDECKLPIGGIFTAMATHHLPTTVIPTTVFHCHAGKDRTGIIAALLLSLAGADDAAIAKDYALSGEYLSEHLKKLRAESLARPDDTMRYNVLDTVTEDSMLTTLRHLRERHGDTPAYLRACGVSDAHIDVLRDMLIDVSSVY